MVVFSTNFEQGLKNFFLLKNLAIFNTEILAQWRCAFPRGIQWRNGKIFWIHNDEHMHPKHFLRF